MSPQPLQFLLLLFAGWVDRKQLDVIDYLKEENKILPEQLDDKPFPNSGATPSSASCSRAA